MADESSNHSPGLACLGPTTPKPSRAKLPTRHDPDWTPALLYLCHPRPVNAYARPPRLLLPSSGDRDNRLVRRTRAALDAWPAPGPGPGPRTVALTPDPGRAGSRRGAPGSPDPGGPGTGRPSGRTRGRGGR